MRILILVNVVHCSTILSAFLLLWKYWKYQTMSAIAEHAMLHYQEV